MISDRSRKFDEYRSICADAAYVPKTRIAAARRLLKMTEHSARAVRIAKRLAWKLVKTANLPEPERISAVRLLEYALGWPTTPDPNIDDSTEGLSLQTTAAERPKPAPIPTAPQTPPPGAIGIAPGSDGFKYYVDAAGNNLGRVPTEGVPHHVEPERKPVPSDFSGEL